jgi:cytochrome P450
VNIARTTRFLARTLFWRGGLPPFIPIYVLHHDPKYYPEPERFDPERFNEDVKAKRHHYVYLPFGEGPRICIGKLAAL